MFQFINDVDLDSSADGLIRKSISIVRGNSSGGILKLRTREPVRFSDKATDDSRNVNSKTTPSSKSSILPPNLSTIVQLSSKPTQPFRQPIKLTAKPTEPRTVLTPHNEPKVSPKESITLKRTGQMWKMNITAQREYLQRIHENDPEPGLKSAQDFISYAQEALNNGQDPDITASADVPSSRRESFWATPAEYISAIEQAKVGNTVKYRIAGEDTSLPYGYPEESIFILTASYRDPEAASTIARAYARAAHPERIFFGIHAQNEGGDLEPERDPIGGMKHIGVPCPSHPVCKRLDHIRVSRAHWSKSEGPTVARALAERLYQNETYVLGIDSHCHFLRGWDNVVIDMFKRIGNDLAIITSYPPSYEAELQLGYGAEKYDVNPTPRYQKAICRTRRMNIHTTVTFKHDMNQMPRPLHGPVRVAFFAAGFSFSRGHRILRVPYDYHTPYIFDGEETSMGVRAWTWGYDLYHPDRDVISHLYIPSHSKLRPVFWDSPNWNIQWPTQFGSLMRLQKQLRIYSKLQGSVKSGPHIEDQLDLDEFEKHDVGPRRNVDRYWQWAGIDLQNNWGQSCTKPGNPSVTGREYCYSANLCSKYSSGGMPYVPWAPGTEDMFPPMIRNSKYPPRFS
eukprot:CAMPEP_0185029734 /NCGR_PEP_ID=MMETSP1103-20130426/16211_1 /TAXON_ID=36769 /ORGANISM="Paraphysomonas bandaiensis, Strain Caron Lab Isolate" /LENGTH=623 /DNA_ID=CAMNT_0027564583 /DNA_START=155 /DNA_END=2026 /DNA_ORIENTATION=+